MRVVAGRLGGRRLSAPRGDVTRPTADRVKEALFSMLAGVDGASVLDLYAGTGSLAIEALSRGAARAVLVENDKAALATLRKNLQDLGISGEATVIAGAVDRSLDRIVASGPYDLVLCDPPYRDATRARELIEILVARGAIAEDARLVLEHASRDTIDPGGLGQTDRRVYGDTALAFFVV